MRKAVKVYFGYKHVDSAWGGANSLIRALHKILSNDPRIDIVSRVEDCDVLFLNSLSKGPNANSQAHTIKEIEYLLKNHNVKLVTRAVNLRQHSNPGHIVRRIVNKEYFKDLRIFRLLQISSYIIFQSEYQKQVFVNAGYKSKCDTVIHNGSDCDFWSIDKRPSLENNDNLNFLSSSFSAKHDKRLDLVAKVSKENNVNVTHVGQWPSDIAKQNVILKGTLTHSEIRDLMSKTHYILHPAHKDLCPNSIIEGLCAGVPVIYNDTIGSGKELVKESGLAININNIAETVNEAREHYDDLLKSAETYKSEYDIKHTAEKYIQVFLRIAQAE